MMNFEFATAARIVFGAGTLSRLPELVPDEARRVLLVCGATAERALPAAALLTARAIEVIRFTVSHEPALSTVQEGVQLARRHTCDAVVALGGGSVIDAGKAIAAMLTNPGDLLDYLEVIGRGQMIRRPPAPLVAIPTTAGAGAEVTRNAVLTSPQHGVKASLRSPLLLPRLALVDPELTLTLPPSVTAATGLDALTQLIEPYVSLRANAFTDMFCREGINRAAAALPMAYEEPGNVAARSEMALASLLGGLALANAGLGAVHGFAAPIGGMFDAPHGAVCAALLPHVMEANLRALYARDVRHPALRRYEEIAALLTGRPQASAEEGVEWVAALCRRLAIPPLRTYGITPAAIPDIVAKASQASSMKGNPLPLSAAELTAILERAL